MTLEEKIEIIGGTNDFYTRASRDWEFLPSGCQMAQWAFTTTG